MGIEDNNITDEGAQKLADALAHNTTLQTLKLNGNNIDSFDTMIAINEKLNQNKEEAMKKLYEEHPEYEMQKIKNLKKKKKKRKNKSDKEKNKRIERKDETTDKVGDDDSQSNIADKFLQERRRSLEDGSGNNGTAEKSLTDKFKSGLKIGSKSTDKQTNKPKGTLC